MGVVSNEGAKVGDMKEMICEEGVDILRGISHQIGNYGF